MENAAQFAQILKISDVELWHVKDNSPSCRARSQLHVFYSRSLDLFILAVDQFKFALDKSLQIIESVDNDNYLSYLIPEEDGYSMLKIIDTKNTPVIKNFDTILDNSCLLLRKIPLKQQEESHPEGKIEKMESSIKEGISRTAGLFSKVFGSEGDTHPNQKSVRSFDQLKLTDNTGVPCLDIPHEAIDMLRNSAKESSVKYQDASHWKDAKKRHEVYELDIAGSGLTAQSMGAEETTQSTLPVGYTPVNGVESLNLPTYELETEKLTIARGFRKASVNLHDRLGDVGKQRCVSHLEDDEMTTGLCTKECEYEEKINRKFKKLDTRILSQEDESESKENQKGKLVYDADFIPTAGERKGKNSNPMTSKGSNEKNTLKEQNAVFGDRTNFAELTNY